MDEKRRFLLTIFAGIAGLFFLTTRFCLPIIQENKEYVSIEISEETSKSWEEDKPSLPVVSKVFTFPFGTRIDSVM